MDNNKYDEIIKKNIKKEKVFRNILISFLSGGILGVFGEVFTNMYITFFKCSLSDGYLYTFCTFILIGSLLTGLGVFDKVLSIFKCGFIVPSTGFANSMTSSSMDYKSEGFVKGIGANIFKLTGSIILYGVVFGIIFGFIRSNI